MITHLILISNSFPYGIREVFLENEIKYLSKSFDKVTVISINLSTAPNSQRKLPHNCKNEYIIFNPKLLQKILSIVFFLNRYVFKEFLELIKTRKLNKKTISILLMSFSKAKTIKRNIENKIDINETNFIYSYWGNEGAIAAGLINKKNIIKFCRVHGADLYFERNQYNYLPFRKTILDKLNAIFPISNLGEKYLRQNWKATTKIHTSRLGVLQPIQFNFNESIHDKELNKFKIVSCSNLITLKRIDLLIKSLSLIKSINIEWTHYGDGIEEKNLKELAFKLLPSNIYVNWKGRMENKKILEEYKILNPDIFINLSSSEGIPVSIMEAMSYGIPCIATNVGGTCEIVNNKNGALLDENPSIETISSQLNHFIYMNKIEYIKYKRNAYLTWYKYFNAEYNYVDFTKKILTLQEL